MGLNMDNILNAGILVVRRLLFAVAACMLLIVSGCSHDDLTDGYGRGNGEIQYARLSLDFGVPAASVVTRAGLDGNTTTKIESLWIGVFDSKTGEQVGRMAGHIRKSDGNRYSFDAGKTSYSQIQEKIDIYYYDSNPEVYIAAVANYTGVMAKMVGEGDDKLIPLAELLGIDSSTESAKLSTFSHKITWDDFRSISVNTASIKTPASGDDYSFMTGFFTTTYTGKHTTVDPDGSMPKEARVPLTTGGSYTSDINLDGAIHLYRLVSEFKVYVAAADNDPNSPYKVKVKNVQYKVHNKPLEVYLAERPTFDKSATAGKGTYRDNSSNSADFVVIENKARGYETDDRFYDAEGNEDEGYYFTFQQYENKHWGADYPIEDIHPALLLKGEDGYNDYMNVYIDDFYAPGDGNTDLKSRLSNFIGGPANRYINEFKSISTNPYYYAGLVLQRNAHAIREARYDGNGYYRALVADPEKPYNNNASYIVLKADVEMEKYDIDDNMSVERAEVEYIIHEGFTTKLDGTEAITNFADATSYDDVAAKMFDFQCTRNTQYTYNIRINGFNDLEMQATGKGAHNDGLSGEIHRVDIREESSDGDGFNSSGVAPRLYEDDLLCKLFLSDDLIYRFYEKTPEGEVNYGNYDPNVYKITDWPEIKGSMESDMTKCPATLKNILYFYVLKGEYDGAYAREDNYARYYGSNDVYVTPRMSLDEFRTYVKETNPNVFDQYYVFYNIGRYDTHTDVEGQYDEYEGYERGFYYYNGGLVSDADGCKIHTVTGYEQHGLYDDRPYYNGNYDRPTFVFNHNNITDGYETYRYNVSFPYNYHNSYRREYRDCFWSTVMPGCGVVGSTSTRTSNDYNPKIINGDRIEMEVQYISTQRNGGGSWVQINHYAVEVENYDKIVEFEVTENPDDEHLINYGIAYKNYENSSYHVVSYPIPDLIRELDLTPGEYRVRIYPMPQRDDNNRFQPFKPDDSWWYPLIIHGPKWNFAEDMALTETINLFNTATDSSKRDYITYGGLTIVGGTGGGGTSGVQLVNSTNGAYINLQGNGSVDINEFRLMRFAVEKHGIIKITLSGDAGNLLVGARKLNHGTSINLNSSVLRPVSGNTRMTVEVDTHDIIDSFEDGEPMEIVFYSNYESRQSNRYYIYEVEFEVTADQTSGLDGSTFDYNIQLGDCYVHPYYIYHYAYLNRTYPQYAERFVAVKGSTAYFLFNDSNPRASAYRFELYEDDNSAQPIFSQEFNAADCSVDSSGNFVLPISVSSDDANVQVGMAYVPKITPLGDGVNYRDGTPHRVGSYYGDVISRRIVEVYDIPDDWLSDRWYNKNGNDHIWTESNPFNLGVFAFKNAAGTWCENKGLVLHGGNKGESDLQMQDNFIQFGGQGWPHYKNDGPDLGRYLSFSVDKPGTLFLVAGCTQNDDTRGYRLFKNTATGPVEIVSAKVTVTAKNNNRAEYTMIIPDSDVDGMTEFFLCADGGNLRLYSLQWSSGTVGKRQFKSKLDWSQKWGDGTYGKEYSGRYGYYTTDGKYHIVSKHFMSTYTITDNNSLSKGYLFEMYPESGSQSQPSLQMEISLDDYPEELVGIEENGDRRVTFAFSPKELSGGRYRVQVTPKVNEEIYEAPEPQVLKSIQLDDWTQDNFYGSMSNFRYWSAADFGAYASYRIRKDDAVEYGGMVMNGSGLKDDDSRAVYHVISNDSPSYFQFPGNGWPSNKNDNNVGKGRNFSFAIDTPGEFWVVARPDTESPQMRLYSNTDLNNPVATADFTSGQGTSLANLKKPVVLKTGDFNADEEPVQFYLVPDKSTVFGIFFVPKDNQQLYGYWDTEHDSDPGKLTLKQLLNIAGEPAAKNW